MTAITSGSDPKNKIRQIITGNRSGNIDFTEFTTVSAGVGGTEVEVSSALSASFDILSTSDAEYIYKSYGVAYFGDFKIAFQLQMNSIGSDDTYPDMLYMSALSNAIESWGDNNTASETQVGALLQQDSTSKRLCAVESNGGVITRGSGIVVTGDYYYCTLERDDTTLTLKAYTDSARSVLVGTDVVTCLATTFRYLYILQAPKNAGGAETIDGWIHKIEMLGTLTTSITKDDDATEASLIVCYETDQMKVNELFSTYDGVVFLSGPEAGYSRYVQDVPAKASYDVGIVITTADKSGITGTIMIHKIQKTLEALIEAAAQLTDGVTVHISGRTRVTSSREGGVTLYTTSYTIKYNTT